MTLKQYELILKQYPENFTFGNNEYLKHYNKLIKSLSELNITESAQLIFVIETYKLSIHVSGIKPINISNINDYYIQNKLNKLTNNNNAKNLFLKFVPYMLEFLFINQPRLFNSFIYDAIEYYKKRDKNISNNLINSISQLLGKFIVTQIKNSEANE